MKLHNAYGYGLFTGGLGLHYGAERLGLTTVPISGGMTERQVQLIADFEPDIITVTPSYMAGDPRPVRPCGHRPAPARSRSASSAPSLDQRHGAEIEQAFNMHLDLRTVRCGASRANECVETKDGLHIWEDHFYPEIIDPVSVAPCPTPRRRAGPHHAHRGEDELALSSPSGRARPVAGSMISG